jgi:hypothetical protein
MKKIITLLLTGILCSCQPDKNSEILKNPRILNLPPQKMLELTLTGDPDGQTGQVKILYQTFFKMKFPGRKMTAPRARWPKPFNTPRHEWIGIWALPVHESVTAVPEVPGDLKPSLATWEYGLYGEILHEGPYSEETASIDKLKAYLQTEGYAIIPESHEEEYLKGPGMFGKGNPKHYRTLIRYRLEKTSPADKS